MKHWMDRIPLIAARHRSDLGFTLFEMIAGLVLMSVLVAVFGMGLTTALEGYDFARNNATISQKGAIAMTRMARELGELTDIVAVGDSDNPFIIYERIRTSTFPPRIRYGLRLDSETNAIFFYEDLQDDITFSGTQGYMLVDGVAGFEVTLFDGDNAMTWSGGLDINALDTVQITLNLIRPEKSAPPQTFITRVDTPNAGR